MVDMAAVAGLMTSLRSIVEITKAMKDVSDANMIQTKVFELTREIMAAQACALEAQTAQSELLNRVRDLETEITKLEAWNAEKQRYKLTDLGRGMTTYTPKEGMEGGEPPPIIFVQPATMKAINRSCNQKPVALGVAMYWPAIAAVPICTFPG
jgi:hypothetical protein